MMNSISDLPRYPEDEGYIEDADPMRELPRHNQQFATQGGGIARWDKVEGRYLWVETPEAFKGHKGFNVGDPIPEKWGLVPIT